MKVIAFEKIDFKLYELVDSFEFLKSYSKIQFIKIIGEWDWFREEEESYDLLGYFPDLLEIELEHPEPISIESFTLLLNTSPNLTKIDFKHVHWVDDDPKELCDKLSNILKGKSLKSVHLGEFACSEDELGALVKFNEKRITEGLSLNWDVPAAPIERVVGPEVEEPDSSSEDNSLDYQTYMTAYNRDGWDSDV